MKTTNLKIKCDEVLEIRPVDICGNNHIELILDDVDIYELMIELNKKLDPEQILDCMKDSDIEEYING